MPRAQYIYFKFEPFILHVSCRTLEYAQIMVTKIIFNLQLPSLSLSPLQLKVAVSSGFKNSGLSVSKKNKIIVVQLPPHSDMMYHLYLPLVSA